MRFLCFAVDEKRRLRSRIRNQGSSLMLAAPLCSPFFFLHASSLPPLSSHSVLRCGPFLFSAELFWICLSKQMLQHQGDLITRWLCVGGCSASTCWLTSEQRVAGSICSTERTGRLCTERKAGGWPSTLHHPHDWSALEQGTESKLIQVCFNANNPEFLFNEMHEYWIWVLHPH